MVLQLIILALSVSIDSFGIGITYGLKNTKINPLAKMILFFISFAIASISVNIGNIICYFFSGNIVKIIGATLLLAMGIWIIIQSTKKKENTVEPKVKSPKVYEFFIRFLGITVKIIQNPIYSDLDKSHNIDTKEAIYLGVALSIDSLCVGISSSTIGNFFLIFPILVSSFQLIFLSMGRLLGEKFSRSSSLPDTIWNVISGSLLVCIGIIRLFSVA